MNNKLMKNKLMIDLETTGVNPGCCILSIGANGYNEDGEFVSFYEKISHNLSIEDGFNDEEQTIQWWMKQSQEAKQEAFSGVKTPKDVANLFDLFVFQNFDTNASNFEVWCCGVDFDFPIIEKFLEKYNVFDLWRFYSKRDYRTIKSVFPEIKNYEINSSKHNALEDAKAQFRGIEKFYKIIG